jgi:uncharacterized membrane protein
VCVSFLDPDARPILLGLRDTEKGGALSTVVHTLHVVSAGMWLGGVVFTMAVVSPALKAMKWSEAERVGVRSVIGRRYAKVGGANLLLLLAFALLDGLTAGFGTAFYTEYALLGVLFSMVVVHGAYFGRKLANLADGERRAKSPDEAASLASRRHALQRISSKVSWLDLAISVAVAVLAING